MPTENPKGFSQQHLFNIEKNKKEKPERRSAKEKRRVQEMLASFKERSGCVDCGQSYPSYILDFDHVYGKKVANIGQMLNYFSIQDIMKEVAKCDVVCSNCHRERTWQRKNNQT